MERKLEHEQLKAELTKMIEGQAARIAELKLDTAVQLEHHSALRRCELIDRRNDALQQIAEITPHVELARQEWNHAREKNRGFEMQWGTMRAKHQQTLSRIEALKEQIEADSAENDQIQEETRTMRDHIERITRDKTTMKEKMKRALECLVVDDSFLKNRLQEEERYGTQLSNALQAMQVEYQDYQAHNKAQLVPLEEDVRLLNDYLQEMQERTRDLQRYCLDVEQKASTLELSWIRDVHTGVEPLEREKELYRLKATVVSMLENQLKSFPEGAPIRTRTGDNDSTWLSHHATVWESIVKEVISEKQKMQRREENDQRTADTAQQLQVSKAELARLKKLVEGEGTDRRILFRQIRDLHFIGDLKKAGEETRIREVKDAATQLDEDLSMVLHFIRKEGFEDYVSSTDGDEDVDETDAFPALEEEGNADIAAVISSYELDPDDPESVEIIQRNLHRPQGPLQEFSKKKVEFLRNFVADKPKQRVRRVNQDLKETLERAVQVVQEESIKEDTDYVRTRSIRIQRGELDPKNERIDLTNPVYSSQAKTITSRVSRWVQSQKDRPLGQLSTAITANAPSSPVRGLINAASVPGRINIPGATVPRHVEQGTASVKASYFLNLGVRGVRLMLYLRRTLEPQLRHIFLSRDLTKVIARRVGSTAPSDEDLWVRISDISAIPLGHRSDVFRDVRKQSKWYMSEDLAFSLVCASGNSFDLEADSVEDRTMWANVFAFITNESRQGGMIHSLARTSNAIRVVDTMNRSPDSVEISERNHLQVIVN